MSEIDDALSILSRADSTRMKAFSETLLSDMGEIEVLQSRTGLVMLPIRDTAQGVAFHLGEVLVSEAHIRVGDVDGYGMRRGHDLEASMAMAIIDLALTSGFDVERCRAFCRAEAQKQADADDDTLRRVEATRVNVETF